MQLKLLEGNAPGLVMTIAPGMFPQILPFAVIRVKNVGSALSALLNFSDLGATPAIVTTALFLNFSPVIVSTNAPPAVRSS